MGHPNQNRKDSGKFDGNVNCGVPAQEVSERKNSIG